MLSQIWLLLLNLQGLWYMKHCVSRDVECKCVSVDLPSQEPHVVHIGVDKPHVQVLPSVYAVNHECRVHRVGLLLSTEL